MIKNLKVAYRNQYGHESTAYVDVELMDDPDDVVPVGTIAVGTNKHSDLPVMLVMTEVDGWFRWVTHGCQHAWAIVGSIYTSDLWKCSLCGLESHA